MSKTYHVKSDHYKTQHHYTYHQKAHNKKIEALKKKETHSHDKPNFNESAFFQEISPLSNFTGYYTEKERRILRYWLNKTEHSFSDERFTKDILMRLIMKLNGMSKQNPLTKNEISKYCDISPSFSENLLNYTQEILHQFDGSELVKLLSFLVHSHIYPDNQWLNLWFQQTEYFLDKTFPENEFGYCIEAVAQLYHIQGFSIKPSWLDKWFKASETHLLTMPSQRLSLIVSMIGLLKITPPQSWMHKCTQRSSDILEGITGKELLQFSYAFYLPKIRNHKILVEKWFDVSLAEMKEVDDPVIMACLLLLVYNNIPIPSVWLDRWMEKIVIEFDEILSQSRYRSINLAYSLYALTLLQADLSFCLPFLEKCNGVFKNYYGTLFHIHDENNFRKIIFAKNYFALLGFTLCINANDYPELLSKVDNFPKNRSRIQDEFAKELEVLFGKSVKEEVKIPVIVDSVDFFIQEKNLIIEVDGNSHFIDGKENALTQVKTFMLEKAGYIVKRFTIDPKEKNLLSLLEKELAEFLPLPDKRNLSRNPKQADLAKADENRNSERLCCF